MSFCVLLFVVSLSALVLGDPNHKWKVTKLEIENKKNDYFGELTGKFENDVGAGKYTFDLPVEKDLPDDAIMVTMLVELPGQDPIEKIVALVDALEEKTYGESFVQAVIPKDTLTKKWPLPKGSYSAKNWSPSMEAMPSGIEGLVRVTGSVGLDGQDPFMKVVTEFELKYK